MVLGDDKTLSIGWQWYKAGDVIDVRDGTHDSPKYHTTGIPLVTSKNLVNGAIDFSTCAFISDADHAAISKRSSVCDGDILYAMIGTIGNPVIVKKEFEFSIKNVALFKFNNDEVYNRFIYHYLQSNIVERQFSKNARGGTQKFVSLGNIRDLLIPLPPLKEQKHIAAVLDKADVIRCKRQQAIDLTDQLLRSVFLDMFGDPVTNPKRWDILPLSTLVSSLESGKNVKPDESGSETVNRILKVSAVTSGVFKPDESKPLPDDFNPPAYYFVNKGDLLISRANTAELIGATAFVHEAQENLILPDKIWRMKWADSNCVHPLYVHYLFQQASIRREISIRSSGTSGSMKNIPKPKLLEIPIPIPTAREQNKFGEIAEKIYLTYKCFGSYGESVSDLLSSLTQQAFNGELSKQTKAA